MPIDPTHNNPSRINGPSAPGHSDGARRASQTAHTKASETANQTAQFRQLDRGNPALDIDTARVDEISQGLADGTLTLDTSRIADGILASAQELAGDE